MQKLHQGKVLFYDAAEDPQKDFRALAHACLAFVILDEGKFRVLKNRYLTGVTGKVVNQDKVSAWIDELAAFDGATHALADIITDGKGLDFLRKA